jgi:DNA-directed RNA polymerase subunit RPC12/RpoP
MMTARVKPSITKTDPAVIAACIGCVKCGKRLIVHKRGRAYCRGVVATSEPEYEGLCLECWEKIENLTT